MYVHIVGHDDFMFPDTCQVMDGAVFLCTNNRLPTRGPRSLASSVMHALLPGMRHWPQQHNFPGRCEGVLSTEGSMLPTCYSRVRS